MGHTHTECFCRQTWRFFKDLRHPNIAELLVLCQHFNIGYVSLLPYTAIASKDACYCVIWHRQTTTGQYCYVSHISDCASIGIILQ